MCAFLWQERPAPGSWGACGADEIHAWFDRRVVLSQALKAPVEYVTQFFYECDSPDYAPSGL